jgi:hypothetical protein
VDDAIFSFGTLRQPEVQAGLFGRAVPTTPDALVGHRLGTLVIRDPEVIRLSGSDVHPALERTGSQDDVVEGAVLEGTPEELAAADHDERVSYERAAVVLASGRHAWAYCRGADRSLFADPQKLRDTPVRGHPNAACRPRTADPRKNCGSAISPCSGGRRRRR